ncbi:UNVERIFIED_CONTAM: Gag-Pol polyprotein [Sesamum latifolium]|uniref:Gag-Pol polyprotein n=1 Tax=Sesamum latifolium TaxID=2727402 RepID=A0AAW2XZ70_9LAMI
MDMPPPRSIREVQKLAGKLAALNRFISRSADKGLPFFKVLREVAKFEWNSTSQLAFDDLKRYLVSPPLLTKPKMGETLCVYLAVSESAIGAAKRPAIKAQVLADFVVELANDEAGISTPTWSLYVDGSSTSIGSGAGVVLESPQGDKFEYAIKLEYPFSNNEAKYEAFLAGGELALAVGAKKIVIYSDSQLVVNQVRGSYEARDENG